jgi:excisionase family DNA binding protein
MIPVSSTKASLRPVIGGRLGRLIARQEESHERLSADPLLTLAEVRRVLGISYSSLNRIIAAKKLTAWQIGRGQRRIRTSVLNSYLASGDQPPAPTVESAKP